jgi:hypothetical protein
MVEPYLHCCMRRHSVVLKLIKSSKTIHWLCFYIWPLSTDCSVDFVESTEMGIVVYVWVIPLILPMVLYGNETWSLTLKGQRRLRVSENGVLKGML